MEVDDELDIDVDMCSATGAFDAGEDQMWCKDMVDVSWARISRTLMFGLEEEEVTLLKPGAGEGLTGIFVDAGITKNMIL
jgi:hypothetical protein